MIFLHVSGTGYKVSVGSYNWYVSAIGDSLVQWSVPIFVMISGALFLNPLKEITTKELYNKYVKRLLIAYIFWWIFYGCISIAIASLSAHSFVFKTSFFEPHFHLWFLPMLMGVYVLIPLIRKITREEDMIKYVLLMWGCYISIGFINSTFNVELSQISVLFTLNIVVGYVGYFILGYYLSKISLRKSGKQISKLIGILGVVIILTGNILLSIKTGMGDERFFNDLSPHIAMMALGLFVAIKESTNRYMKYLKKIVDYVRKDLFGIYLIHGVYLLLFNRAFFRDISNHAITLPLITIAIFTASLFTCKFMRRIPVLRRVVE